MTRVIALPLPAGATKAERQRQQAFGSWVQKTADCPVPHCRATRGNKCVEVKHGGLKPMILWHPARQTVAEKRLAGTARGETGAVA